MPSCLVCNDTGFVLDDEGETYLCTVIGCTKRKELVAQLPPARPAVEGGYSIGGHAKPSGDVGDFGEGTKERLLLEAATILEQEGWLLVRLIRDVYVGRRLRRFTERYQEWQHRVNEARAQGKDMWPTPPDNS